MRRRKESLILHNRNRDGVDRRGFLKCMAWAGTGALFVVKGGVLRSYSLSDPAGLAVGARKGELSFIQISDSHMGFDKAANPDVVATLRVAVDRINSAPTTPAFLLHTGDISHLSKPSEFDTVDQVLKSAKASQVFYVPGEHDVLGDDGKQYLERYGKGTKGGGWYSFDHKGVHFIGLVNVLNLKAGGLGTLGSEQLEWLEDDVKGLSARHSDCGVCPYSAVGRLSGMGVGHGRQRPGARLSQAVWLRHRAERSHPPDHAKGGRKYYLPHRNLHGLSATSPRHGALPGTHEGAGRAVAELVGINERPLRDRQAYPGHRRFVVGVIQRVSLKYARPIFQ